MNSKQLETVLRTVAQSLNAPEGGLESGQVVALYEFADRDHGIVRVDVTNGDDTRRFDVAITEVSSD